jgi:hypothetical protein
MTMSTWVRKLFARPVFRPNREAPAWGPPATEALEERAPSTITCNPAGGKARQHRGPTAPREQALGSLAHTGRFSPVTIGFWLGGVGLGTGGCLLGALMPYRHPAAVALSVLWWGLYFGCFGASVGALVGVPADRAPPRPAVRRGRAEEVTTKLGRESRAARAGSPAVCAPRGQRGLPGRQRERERPA